MNNLKAYLIPFIGLKIGKHQFDYQVDNTFFAHFDYDEFNDASVKVSVAQYIYESIILSVPLRRIHPGVKDGSLSHVIDKLESLSPQENKKEEQQNNDIDPRWENLKKLLTDK